MWTILSENTNKYVHAKLREAKDKGDKDPIELLSEGADQNACAQLNKWEDTSLDEMKVFVAHLIVMGILKKNSLQMRPTHQREKLTMILCFWLGQWWT